MRISVLTMILLAACGSGTEPSDQPTDQGRPVDPAAWLGTYLGTASGVLFGAPPGTDTIFNMSFLGKGGRQITHLQDECDPSEIFIAFQQIVPAPLSGNLSVDWMCVPETMFLSTRFVLEAEGEQLVCVIGENCHIQPFGFHTQWSLDLTLAGDTISGQVTADRAVGFSDNGPIDVQVVLIREPWPFSSPPCRRVLFQEAATRSATLKGLPPAQLC